MARVPALDTPRYTHPLKVELCRRGETLAELAARIDYAPDHVSKVLRRVVPATTRFRAAVSRDLGIPESVLFKGEPTSDPDPWNVGAPPRSDRRTKR